MILHIDGEGIRDLYAEAELLRLREGLETPKHRDGIPILQILPEMEVRELNVVVAHAVQKLPRLLIAEQRGIALYEGVQSLFRDQIGGDRLDLLGGTAVQGGDGHGIYDILPDRLDVLPLEMLEAVQVLEEPGPAALKALRLSRVHHLVDKAVHLRRLDAGEIVADGDIELEGIRVAQPPLLCHHLQQKPCLYIFVKGLGDLELCGPLAVIALVLCADAGLLHAGGELPAVHFLDGLQLKEARSAVIRGGDILRKLRVGAGRRSDLGLQLPAKEMEGGGRLRFIAARDAEDGALLLIFQKHSVHQLPKGNRDHNITHSVSPFPEGGIVPLLSGEESIVSSPPPLPQGKRADGAGSSLPAGRPPDSSPAGRVLWECGGLAEPVRSAADPAF